jgi:phospholipid/cholesterol/gamma-HCH transport system substrate-binding protein
MLGDAVIEFVDSDVNATPNEFIQDGGRIEGDVRSNPLDVIAHIEGDLGTAIKSIAKTSDEIRALAHNVNDILGANDDQFTRIVDKTEQTIDALRVAVGNIDELLSDQQLKDDLKRAIANFPVVLEEARETVSGLKNTLAGVDRNLANLEGLTKPLGERGGKLVENIESSTAKLDAVLSDISEFSQGLNDPKGTLGQLLNNPDLYQQANSAVANLNELTKELRPIVSDVRTFTSKISRHPNQLIFRSSGAKYSDLEMSGAGPAAPSTRSGFAPRGAR